MICLCIPRCRAVFLHVITYNTAAMSLYSRQGFSCVAKLRAFYCIATGRTPDPNLQVRPEQQDAEAWRLLSYVACLHATQHSLDG